MNYSANTLFRLKAQDNSKHYTAILLKNGKIYEVKNSDTHTRGTTYNSLEDWKNSKEPSLTLSVDTSKSRPTFTIPENKGFNYPNTTDLHTTYNWIQWCYSIVCEAAPHLLDNDDFRMAYNEMVDICTTYKNIHYAWHITKHNRYSLLNIGIKNQHIGYSPNSTNLLGGYHGHILKERNMSQDDFKSICDKFYNVYKKIVNIISPEIEPYMKRKITDTFTKKAISFNKAFITRTTKRISRLEKQILTYKEYIIASRNQIAEKEQSLLSNQVENMSFE
jgi:hypothetical protein